MKEQTEEFDNLSALSVLEPRYVLALSFDDDDTDVTYLTSHSDSLDPGSIADIDRIDGCIISISGQSQKINPAKSQHTIGGITIRLLDVNGEISTKIKTKLEGGEGVNRKNLVLYQGFKGIPEWSDYSKRLTYKIDGLSYQNGVYILKASDIQRTTKTKIFDIHQGVLTSTITASDTLIPVTTPNASGKFPLVAHDAAYSANASTLVGYIRIDDEIIAHSGWSDGTYTALTVVERGALGTGSLEHIVDASTDDDRKKKVDELVYLEMPVPKMIYAILTGVLYGQSASLPDHWHLSVPTGFVDIDSFTGIGSDLWDTSDNAGRSARFIGEKDQNGKSFIESQLLSWSGLFMLVNSSGQYVLRKLSPVLPYSSYAAYIDESEIVSYTDLVYDQKAVINNIVVKWNWIETLERFAKTTQLVDSNSVSKHGLADTADFEFRGVFVGIHSDADLQNYFKQIRDRYGSPPLRLKVTVHPYWSVLEVGDPVRIKNSYINDYHLNETLDRVFEVQGVTTDWVTGKVTLDLFGGVEPGSNNALSGDFVMSDDFYTDTGTNLTSALTISGGAVTASGTLTGGASHESNVYYYDSDLTINSGVVVTIEDNVQLRIKGTLIINGDIDGAGNGLPGGVHIPGTIPENGGIRGGVGSIGVTRGAAAIPAGSGGPTSGVVLFSYFPWTSDYYNPDQINSLNILNPDGQSLTGIPSDLRGSTSPSGGGAAGYTPATIHIADGGDSGDGGAGLVIISRGGGFGPSGGIDLSGGDGELGDSGSFHGTIMHAGPGVGGNSGGLVWMIDGNGAAPSKNFLTFQNGLTPTPDVDEIRVRWLYEFVSSGRSAAVDPIYQQVDQRDVHVNIGYIPKALNGYTWLPAQEEDSLGGYGATQSVDAPTSITLASNDDQLAPSSDGTVISRIKVTWVADNQSGLDGFEIEYKKSSSSDWLTAETVSGVTRSSFISDVEDGIDYDVRIRSLSWTGYKSAYTESLGHTVIGKTAKPSDVSNFVVLQDGNSVTFKWDKITDLDRDGYDIRYSPQGSTIWEDATPITEVTKGTNISSTDVAPGNWTFFIKAVDTGKRESTNANTFDAVISNPLNVIETQINAPEWAGTYTGFVRHHTGVLVPLSTSVNSDIGWRTFDEFVPDPISEATYETPEIDIDFDDNVRVWGEIESSLGPGETGLANPHFQVDYKLSAGSYSGFVNWSTGELTFRYCKAKLVLDTAVGIAIIKNMELTTDKKEKIVKFESLTIAPGGTTVNFDVPFHTPPFVRVFSETGGVFPTRENVTINGFDYHMWNTSGTDAGGTGSAEAIGV